MNTHCKRCRRRLGPYEINWDFCIDCKHPIYDRFDREVKAGMTLDVQRAGEHVVIDTPGGLCFRPYGKLERVCDYLRNDIAIVEASS